MGCGSTKAVDVAALSPKAEKAGEAKVQANGAHAAPAAVSAAVSAAAPAAGGAPAAAAAGGGAAPAAALDPKEEEKKQKEILQQRRRLSVKPGLVGDVKGQKAVKKEEAIHIAEDKNFAFSSKKGFIPYNRDKVNQDRFVITHAVGGNPSVNLFGVMDGHGEFGHEVASFVSEKLPKYLAQQQDLATKPRQSILDAVDGVVQELKKTNINVSFSGSTLVFCVQIGETLYVANVGDSRCVLGYEEENKIKPTPLSIDQKPEVPEESKRIRAAGGRVEPLPGLPGEDMGPPRVWLPEVDVPGLAMSRSIGDAVSQTVGVISVPEIIEHKVEDKDRFIVLASDGVWEFVSNQEVVDIVQKNGDNLKKAAEALVAEGEKRWSANEEVIDDITVVILKLSKAAAASPVANGAAPASPVAVAPAAAAAVAVAPVAAVKT